MNYSQKEYFTVNTPDRQQLSAKKYLPDAETEASLIIVHGMAEHQERYAEFAEHLRNNFFAVYTYDQRGHGKTAGSPEKVGFFAPENGHRLVVNDLDLITDIARKEHPNTPVIIFGHSMGSFICRNYILEESEKIDGLILSGTAAGAGALGKIGTAAASIIALLYGKRHPSKLMDALSFGSFNKKIKPARTKFDWLSRDNAAVNEYINDPYCGSIFSAQFFKDMLRLIEKANNEKKAELVSHKTMPVLFISGEADPVGDFGKGVKKVSAMYEKAGFSDTELKLYPQGRHEMLNETNKTDVYAAITDWLNKKTTQE